MTDKLSDQLRFAMAFSRRDFIDRANEYIAGAIIEFYKVKLAKKNGFTKWVVHWDNESKRLIDRQLVLLFLHPIRGFKDTKSAALQALSDIMVGSNGYQTVATNDVKKDFKVQGLQTGLDEQDAQDFKNWVSLAIEANHDLRVRK